MKDKYMTVEEWQANNPWYPYHPVILNEGLAKIFHDKGLITNNQLKLLEEDKIVSIGGYWTIISRFLTTH